MPSGQPNEATIFNAARKITSADERAAYLSQACGDDSALRDRVQKRLTGLAEESQALERSVSGLDETVVPGASGQNLAAALDAGLAATFGEDAAVVLGDKNHSVLTMLSDSMVDVPRVLLRQPAAEGLISQPNSPEIPYSDSDGRYRLDGEIGRGGMGAILKGRDTDLGRDLAIKVLLDSHKDNPQVIQRFIEEAQIGGQLQHPGIAPVYELGQFADQRPFFSMKLVKGKTLANLLANREDSIADRGKLIGIFEQICQTMAYAHSRDVIHRDLKPANIMVGAFGEVQVMDWGLAKVLQTGDVAEGKRAKRIQEGKSVIQTMRTTGSDVPGSSDSAGAETQMGSVMGTPAYMPPEQALGEIDQLDQRADVFGLGAILCEILTGKPPYVGDDGTKVFRMASRGKLDDAFARLNGCSADPDLIALAKDCMNLEPADRPNDAGVLSRRITTYIESVEQKLRDTELAKVNAQVRAEELRRRQRLAYTAGAAIVNTLLIGIAVSLWQMSCAREAEKETAAALVQVEAERDAKELARRNAEQISMFLSEVLASPDPTKDGREIKVVELLNGAAKRLETDPAVEPERRAMLQNTLGRTYSALGVPQRSIPLQQQVRDYYFSTSGPEHHDTIAAMNDLAVSYVRVGRIDEALKLQKEVVTLRRKVLGDEHPETLNAMANLANCYEFSSMSEALKIRQQLVLLFQQVSGDEHPATIDAMHNLAASYGRAGRTDEALELQEEVLKLQREFLGREHPDTLGAMNNLALIYSGAGDLSEALRLREEVLPLYLKVLGREHPGTLGAMSNLALSYQDVGRLDDAIKLLEETLTLGQEVEGPSHPSVLTYMSDLSIFYKDAGRLNEAIELCEETLMLRRQVLASTHPDILGSMTNLAGYYNTAGRMDEALELQKEALAIKREVLPISHPFLRAALGSMASIYANSGRTEDAIKLYEECLALSRKVLRPEHPHILFAMHELAYSYYHSGKREEALKLRKELLLRSRRVLGPEHPGTLSSMHNLAISYGDAGKKNEALELQKEVLPLRRQVLGAEHPDTLWAMHNLARSYHDAGQGKQALMLQDEVLRLRRRVLGPEHPDTFSAMHDLALVCYGVGKATEALKLREELLTLRPDHPRAFNAAAWQLATNPDEDGGYSRAADAVAWARRASELAPKHGGTLNTLGIALYRANEWQETIDVLLQSIQLGSDDPYNWLFITMAHWQLDQKDQARQWYDKSLEWQTANADTLSKDAELQRFFAEAVKLMAADADQVKENAESEAAPVKDINADDASSNVP